MEGKHTADLLKDKLYALIYLQGEGKEGPQYVYLSVRMDQLKALTQARLQDTAFEPSDFGKVLAHGAGYPDDDTKRYMQDTYGFSHDEYVDLIDQPDND